jgi:hypothetical protein
MSKIIVIFIAAHHRQKHLNSTKESNLISVSVPMPVPGFKPQPSILKSVTVYTLTQFCVILLFKRVVERDSIEIRSRAITRHQS